MTTDQKYATLSQLEGDQKQFKWLERNKNRLTALNFVPDVRTFKDFGKHGLPDLNAPANIKTFEVRKISGTHNRERAAATGA